GQSAEQRLLALYLAANREAILRAPSDDPTPVEFRVESGDTGASVASRLEEEGLIGSAELFRRLLRYRGADQSLEAGLFQLARNMTMDEIILTLQQGAVLEVDITLLEGWRAGEMAGALEASGLITGTEYLALVQEPSRFDYEFLRDLPAGSTLEGYLFPDTYTVAKGEASAESIIRRQLDNFDRRMTPELRAAAGARSMTLHEAVTLASIVEREAVVLEERGLIAGVFINRWLDSTVLNADPTIQYALGLQEESGDWWKRPLTSADLAIDSPYNTYTQPGLPPGPISNPGLDTLRATIEAPNTNFYYFVSRNDGTHVFATTLEEHLRNVEQFQSGE
ncbi:MAG: endolytic transglycosylase MltG, partial [Ardenticatenaceae bacterium]